MNLTRLAPSSAQERLWFLARLRPDGLAYTIPMALRIAGPLDVAALQAALTELVARHEALRTRFEADGDGRPYRIIDPPGALELATVSAPPGADPAAEYARWHGAQIARPFDLQRGPLLRAELFRLGPDEHVLMLVLHHIIADAWSGLVLFEELDALYAAARGGRALRGALPPAPGEAELSAARADGAQEDELRFWQAELSGAPTVLELPADRTRPPVQGESGAHAALDAPPALATALEAFALRSGVTPFIAAFAAFTALVYRYSAEPDFVVGVPAANRLRPQTQRAVGYFVNMLPLRTRIEPGMTFAAHLARVRDTALDAFSYQGLQLETLIERLGVPRDASRSPLVQVVFSLHDEPPATLPLDDLVARFEPVELPTAKFDLALSLAARDGRLRCTVEYDAQSFGPQFAAAFGRQYLHLLGAALHDPAAALDALPLLGAQDVAAIERFERGPQALPAEPFVHHAIAAHAAARPQLAAVVEAADAGLRSTSFGELVARAGALAAALRARGVVPGDVVACALEKGADWAATALAILAAGAVYLPLDPAFPPERLNAALADARAAVLVSTGRLADRLSGATPRLLVEDVPAAGAPFAPLPLPPGAPAYAIYTSGSTGRAKGVLCRHDGLANVVASVRRRAPLAPGTRCAGWYSTSFDLSLFDLFGTLCEGGTLHVVPDEVRLLPEELIDWLTRHDIEAIFLPAHAVKQLATALANGRGPRTLRRLFVGAEPIDEAQARQILAALPGLRMLNAYGPTEITIFCTLFDVAAGAPGTGSLPIGMPLDDLRVHVLDPHGGRVPIGVAGEIFVGGPAVAQGYIGRVRETAERFVPDPFGAAGGRLYRTGDRGRWRADGALQFLGRGDRQTKYRGFRVEPSEIEARLLELPAVADAAVVVRGDGPAEQIVAFVVPAAGAAQGDALETELKDELRAHLPWFMVPGRIVVFAALPATSSGKTDLEALRVLPLPAPPAAAAAARSLPANELERTIARAWGEVLGGEPDLQTNFFDLGGTSLDLARVSSLLKERLATPPTLLEMFSQPTIRALAAHLAAPAAAAEDKGGTRGERRRGALERLRRPPGAGD